MITHIVLWKLHPEADGRSAEENARIAKEKIENLRGKIPTLLHIEAGIDVLRSDASADISLYSRFDSLEGLDAYQVHPEHQAIIPFMKAIAASRTVIDYETPDNA